jgi:hypothetical protein
MVSDHNRLDTLIRGDGTVLPVMESIRRLWKSRPVAVIMVLALLVRVIAAIFAKGYGMHDDHFSVIETAQKWVDGYGPPGRNPFYAGLHFLLFRLLEGVGVLDPQAKMYVVRFLHAIYSLLTVWFGIKLTELLAGRVVARKVGLLLAVFWVFPFMSVRNLVEFVCVPPLVITLYVLMKPDRHEGGPAMLAGVAAALAFVVRYQTISFLGTVGIILLARREWKKAALVAAGSACTACLILGVLDWVLFGVPFRSIARNVAHNLAHPYSYVTNPWYTYLGTIVAGFIPPLSLLLVWAFLRSRRKAPILFWPTLVFLIIHSLYPNKQERFILPVVPFLLMGAIVGWKEVDGRGRLSRLWGRLVGVSWGWFWVANGTLLALSVLTYSKKARVDSMSYLYSKGDVVALLVENHRSSSPRLPLFYLDAWCPVYDFPASKSVGTLREELRGSDRPRPNYVLFLGSKNLGRRIQRTRELFPDLEFETEISPSLTDHVLYRLNPERNVNQTSYIYRIIPGA